MYEKGDPDLDDMDDSHGFHPGIDPGHVSSVISLTTFLGFCLGSFRKGPFRNNVQTNRSSQNE